MDARQDTVEATLQGEAMYPRTSEALWQQVQAVSAQLKLGVEKRDQTHQVLVTKWASYDARVLPDPAALNLPPTDRPVRVQFHIAVAPGYAPARVAAGSILDLARNASGATTEVLVYRKAALEDWFFERVDAAIGVRHEPMAATLEGRRKQALRLMPPGLTDPCLLDEGDDGNGGSTPPVKVSEVHPVFPAQGFETGEAETQVTGMLTEHGTLTNLHIANPVAKFAHYEASARAACGLWRFEPARRAGCPVVSGVVLRVHYTLR